jgi:hypothetical protein
MTSRLLLGLILFLLWLIVGPLIVKALTLGRYNPVSASLKTRLLVQYLGFVIAFVFLGLFGLFTD